MGKSIRKVSEMPLQNQPALGQKIIVDIPLVADLENLLLDLTGTVTLSTAASALLNDGIANIIEQVELIGDGRDTIISLPFNQIVNGNMFRRKRANLPTVTQPGVTAAAHAFEASGVLDLAAFAALRGKDSNLRENKYKTLQLGLRFGTDWTKVFTGGGFVVSAQTFALVIRAKETIELTDDAGMATAPIMRALQSSRDDTVTGATLRQRFILTPDQALRGVGLRCVNASNALSDAVLSRVRVYVGNDLRVDLSAAALKRQNTQEFSGAVPTGYYFLDFADGCGSPDKMNDCLDLRREVTSGAMAYLEYDSAAAMSVNIAQYGFVRG